MKPNKKHVGSDFQDFLQEKLKSPSFRRGFEKARLNIVVGSMVRRILKHKKMSLRALAKKMDSSVSQVQRLIQDDNVSLDTLARFAAATGSKVSVQIK